MVRRGLVVLAALLLGSALPVDGGELVVWTPLIPGIADSGDRVGEAIAVDMPWLAVGAPSGRAVHLYELDDGQWRLRQTLHGTVSGFGTSVAISGGHLAVGAPAVDTVFLYRLGSRWEPHGELTGPDEFGADLDIDGNTMAIGAPGASRYDLLAPSGEVRVYAWSGSWELDQTLRRGGLGAETQFGAAVDLDGDKLIIGAPAREIEDEVFQGAVYIYGRTSTWVQQAHLTVDGWLDRAGSFGHVVAISGSHAIAAAPPRLINGVFYIGHLFYYEQRGATWTEIDSEDFYEESVAMDGRRAVLGAQYDDRARVVERTGSTWRTVKTLYDFSSWRDSDFGASVAIEEDKVFVGAPRQDGQRGRAGAVWTFVENVPPVAVAGLDQRILVDDAKAKTTVLVDGSGSFDADGEVVRYEWTHGDIIRKGAQASFSLGSGDHTLRLRVWDDLGFSDADQIHVQVLAEPKVHGSFDFKPDRRDPGTPVRFTDTSASDLGIIVAWDWDFDGDGRTDATGHAPTYQYTRSGTFEAKLTVRDHLGLEAVATRTVTVTDADPTADAGDDIIASPDAEVWGTVTLDGSASRDSEGPISKYQWSVLGLPIGEGESIEYQFREGVTEVRLAVTDAKGQQDTDFVKVLVPKGGPNGTKFGRSPDAVSHWQVHPDDLPRTLLFRDESTDADGPVALVGWDFNMDGDFDSEDYDTTHAFPRKGEFQVKHRIVDLDGEMETTEFTVMVPDQPPEAAFSPAKILRVPLGAPVVFFDKSRDHEDPIVRWQWDFNGTSSNRQDLGHIFTTTGRHDITLTVTDTSGQTDTATGFVEVFEVSPEVLANWTQEDALAIEARGQDAFALPGEPGYAKQAGDDEAPDARTEADVTKASPWRLTEEIEAPQPKLWWLWMLLGAVLLLLVVDQSRRARRRKRR